MPNPVKQGPFWKGDGVELYLGDVREQLRLMPPYSVQCCVTSPPYWGLRSYDTGDAKHYEIGAEPSPDCGTQGKAQCGACFVCNMVAVFREVRRVLRHDGVLFLNLGDSYSGGKTGRHDNYRLGGLPETGCGRAATDGIPSGNLVGVPWRVALALQADGWILRQDIIWAKRAPMPESVRNRCTKAHEYVFVLTKSKDYFWDAEAIREESDNIWNAHDGFVKTKKRTADRLGISAEDTDRMRTQFAFNTHHDDCNKTGRNKRSVWEVDDEAVLARWLAEHEPEMLARFLEASGNKPDVWWLSSGGYSGAHFATFPPKLITPMILAGTSEYGACAKCGAPWERVVSSVSVGRRRVDGQPIAPMHGFDGFDQGAAGSVETTTNGWQPTCECNGRFEWVLVKVEREVSLEKNVGDHEKKAQTQGDLTRSTLRAPGDRDRSLPQNRNGVTGSLDGLPRRKEAMLEQVKVYRPGIPLEDHPVVPCVVLDPFMGSGTTALTALELGRHAVGIDLSEKYMLEHAVKRLAVAQLNRSRRPPVGDVRVPGEEVKLSFEPPAADGCGVLGEEI